MTSFRSARIALYVLLIFLGGLVSGVLLGPRVGRVFLRPPPPGAMSRHMMKRLQSKLNLTPEQAAQVKPLLEATGTDLDAMRRETTRRVSERIAQSNAAIAELLTPEQKRELEKMEEERKLHMHRWEHFGAPPPHP